MKPFLFICMLIASSSVCAGPASDSCTSFHKGNFYYLDSSGNTVSVIRKKNRQYEHNEETKVNVDLKIKWISDCEYELTQVYTNSKSGRKRNGAVMKIVITKIREDNSYEYTCGCKYANGKEVAGIMTRRAGTY